LLYYTKFFITFGWQAFILSLTASVFTGISMINAWKIGIVRQLLKSLKAK
jgi:hypothetical protein